MSIKPEQKSYVLMRRSKGEEWFLESNNEAVGLMGQVFSLPRLEPLLQEH